MAHHLGVCLTAMVGLVTVAVTDLAAADDSVGEYGGYMSNEESRFEGYVWDFVDELANDGSWYSTDYVEGPNNDNFSRTQYYWGACYQLKSAANSYVDSVDMAYVAGHGSASSITMASGESSCDLTTAAWGLNDLETIVFHSCKVLEMGTNWWTRWQKSSSSETRPFSGLHHACGFKTNHNNGLGAGTWTSDEFAENLDENYVIRWAWYEAVEDGYWLSPYAVIVDGLNKQAVFYMYPNRDETMQQIRTNGNGDIRFGNSQYSIYAYHRN